nr:NADH dehydrogenase subunit 4L [Pingus sinensis]
MICFFVGCLGLMFKWGRLIFFLISLEFMILGLFVYYCSSFGEMSFFYFMSFSVISSVLGVVVLVSNMSFFGGDLSIF